MDIKENAQGLSFAVYVQPRASKKKIAGCYQDAMKIKLTAPPVGGAANKQCIEVLAKALGMPKSTISITGGQTHRLKQIQVSNKTGPLTAEQIRDLKEKLRQLVQTGK